MKPFSLSVVSSLLFNLSLILAQIQIPTNLVGTWTSKSQQVLTGPGFYNPVADRLIEPALTGISYSFTADGWYEEAYYRAIANPTNPKCPSGVMQWQHGNFQVFDNGSMVLTPIAVDGRQLISIPCMYESSEYTRYSQFELIKSFEVITDKYHNVPRLNLYKFDGSPQQPLYLNAQPPQMLPTQTLNPTPIASATGKAKREINLDPQFTLKENEPLNRNAVIQHRELFDAENLWWAGIGLIVVGSAMYMYPSSK